MPALIRLLAVLVVCALPTAAGSTNAARAVQQFTLDNGMQVVVIPDHRAPVVTHMVWYKVGAADEVSGQSGIAHFLEHMMFKASRNLVPEQFDRLTEDVGGFNNASTNDDYTNYYEVVPANHLQRLLWAEAERMSSLVIEPAYFNSDRDVVKEELDTSLETFNGFSVFAYSSIFDSTNTSIAKQDEATRFTRMRSPSPVTARRWR